MRLTMRAYHDEYDYWRLRAFLRDVFVLNGRRELSWQAARLDYWRYFGNPRLEHYPLDQAFLIWETPDGRIAGFVCPENRGHAHMHVHPALRTIDLEHEMIEAAKLCLSEQDKDSARRTLTLWAHSHDTERVQLIRALGFVRGDWPEHQFRRTLDQPIPDAPPPDGYAVRALGDREELPQRSWVSWRAFHPDEPDANYQGWDWYADIQRCPMYRRDLDLVAVAPDGRFAAFTTLWYDDVTRTGYFEPVGTAPEHQRRGLARAVMCEGLRRLKALGGTMATVAGYSDAAIRLYTVVMGAEPLLYERWLYTGAFA